MEKLKGVLPWTKSCFVCGEENPRGLHLRSRIEAGRVMLDYTTRTEDVGYREIVHGGIAATLLDEVMTWAAIVAMRKICVAAEMTTRFRRPLHAGVAIQVEGWMTRQSRRICYTEGVILDQDGNEMLVAEGKYMAMSADGAELCAKDFVKSPAAIDPAEITREV